MRRFIPDLAPIVRMLPSAPAALSLSRRDFLIASGVTTAVTAAALPLVLSACGTRRSWGRSGSTGPVGAAEPEADIIRRPLIPRDEPIVRVRIAVLRGTNESRVELGRPGDWLRVREAGGARRGLVLRGPIRASFDARGWVVEDAGGLAPTIDPQAEIEIGPPDDDTDPRRFVITAGAGSDGAGYPGRLRLVRRRDERGEGIDLVNDVPIELYLPGVLVRELFRHWHVETFAAQAVAARSFACVEAQHWAKRRHFDLHNTQASQAYVGATAHERSLDAAARTRGQVLAFGGFLVPAYYSSCCGGASANATDEISRNPVNDVPPLLARAAGGELCQAAPVYAWTIDRSAADVAQRLRAFGRERKDAALSAIDAVAGIEPMRWNTAGRPTRYRVTMDDRRTVEIEAPLLQRALNTGVSGANQALRSSNLLARRQGETIRFEGRGFGHGVGLCQYGAQARAARGDSYTTILNHYYPGAELLRAYV